MKPKSTLRPSGCRVQCLKIILASKLRLSVAYLKPERITETSMSWVVWPEEAKWRNHKKCFKIVWKPFNDFCYYVNKNIPVKPLSSTLITSVFITICLLEIVQFVANLAMITALKCSGLSHAFPCVVDKNKNVIHQPRSVRIGKNCALRLEYRRRPAASGGIQDLGHSFSQYGPPSWWIAHINGVEN